MTVPAEICQVCGVAAPTRHVEFHQNIGMGFSRRYQRVSGNLCRNCIGSTFWNFTSVTCLVGWIGVISIAVTPFILLNNLSYYLTSLQLPRAAENRSRPVLLTAPLAVFAVLGALLIACCFCVFSLTTLFTLEDIRSVASGSQPAPATARSSPAPSPTLDCTYWTRVTEASIGKTICVYGKLHRILIAGRDYEMLFGLDTESLYLLAHSSEYPGIGPDDCVAAQGDVRSIDGRLAVVVTSVRRMSSIDALCR